MSTQLSCDTCDREKACKLPFHGHMEIGTAVGEIFYSDVEGPFLTSRNGMRYFNTFIDRFSTFIWVIGIPTNRVSEIFSLFLSEFENNNWTLKRVKRLNSDLDPEYSLL